MGLMKDLQGLSAAYASMNQTDEAYELTAADKRGNTDAWRNRNKKNVKTGQPLYKYADHLKKQEESRLWDEVSHALTELHELGGVQFKVVPLNEKESYKTVAAVIDYDRSKKGTDDATYDSEHGEKKKAKKERDYADWEREKMKKDDPNWKHKKYSTSEDKNWGYDKKGNSLNPVDIEKKKKKDNDLAGAPNTKKEELEATGKFTAEEIENLLWNEFDEGYQRDPEKGEAEAKKADKRSAKQKRMDSPDKGINSPAFKEFMRSRGM